MCRKAWRFKSSPAHTNRNRFIQYVETMCRYIDCNGTWFFLCTNLKGADMKVFLFSKCMDGYLLSLGARHLSQHTIDDYTRTLTKFAKFLDEDYPVTQITSQHIENFLESYKNLSNKSL